MLARSPVTRLSITTTRCPSAIRRSVMWLPMKPAPPVIRIRIFLPICEDRETEGKRDGEKEDETQTHSISLFLFPFVSLPSSLYSSVFKSCFFDRLWV